MHLPALTRLAVTWLVAMIALSASSAFADVANGLRYTVPAKWSAADKDGVRVVAPTNLASGEIMMAVLIGVLPSSGTPEQQIEELAATINADVKVNTSSDVLTTDRGSAGKIYIKNFDVASSDMGTHGRMVAILARGNQRAAILFLITDSKVLETYGAGMQELLKSFAIDGKAVSTKPVPPTTTPKPVEAPKTSAPKAGAGGHLPTGETPDLYPGSTGWLPSGRGVPIPVARVVKGKPEGLWCHFQSRGSKTSAVTTIFLADGTRASNPRYGSGTLFDVEGQRKAPGTTGLGTFSIQDGKITQVHDGFTSTHAFKTGSTKEGAWIEIGGGRYFPLSPVTAKELVGNWKSAGHQYKFRADGTLEGGGSWQLDGYLLGVQYANGAQFITSVGKSGTVLIIGSSSYSREP